MFARIAREHHQKQAADKLTTDHLHKDATTSTTHLTDSLADSLNLRIALAFKTERDIEAESKRLAAAIGTYERQTRAWIAIVGEFNDALKELGDIGSWAGAVERDLRDTCEVVERAAAAGGRG
ncbi:GCN5-like 1 [Fimicolochytrium jonesii]|uniref:GCN5-like 1 n=1 Tax=Fimicolochytrium jonesii TaxID=1396493 RepID=UPI0022FE2E1A|nr:GCN5-like 1 [Fimicolochytrium jonesii]KAI8827262.1 GCN5-like 1 [Fimicolochytrium jonesii]